MGFAFGANMFFFFVFCLFEFVFVFGVDGYIYINTHSFLEQHSIF